jgi:hypothetical protein
MKKLSTLLATACLMGSVALCPNISFGKTSISFFPQAAAQQGDKPDAASEKKAYDAYNAAKAEKDSYKQISMAKEALQLYPKSQYAPYFKQIISAAYGKLLTDSIKQPGSEDMNTAFKVVADAATDLPDFHLNYLLALLDPLSRFSKKPDTPHAEKGLPVLKETADLIKGGKIPQGVKPEDWVKKKTPLLGSLYQAMGLYTWKANKNDADALNLFKESVSQNCSDPFTHYYVSEIHKAKYDALSKEYDTLPDDKKTGDEGKALLEKINGVVDQMLENYGRVLAVSEANAKTYEKLRTAVQGATEAYWKFRHEDKLDGLKEFLEKFKTECNTASAAPGM